MEEAFLDFFASHKRLFLTFHLIGVAVGMGGATIADILFFNFLRDFRISRKEAEVMGVLSSVIMLALGLLYLSGVALVFSDMERFLHSPVFLAKAAILVALTINGVLMHNYIAPRMIALSFRSTNGSALLQRRRALAFAMGAISFTSWYAVFFIAMLKSYLSPAVTTLQIIGCYFLVLSIAILVSQVLHRHLCTKSAK